MRRTLLRKTEVADGRVLSTVDLFGIPHTWPEKGLCYFETVVTDGTVFDVLERYETRADAEAGHAKFVAQFCGAH